MAGTEFHPGIAAEVGDQTITTRHVDEVTHDYCTGFEKLSKADPQVERQPVPLRYVTNQFATILVDAGRRRAAGRRVRRGAELGLQERPGRSSSRRSPTSRRTSRTPSGRSSVRDAYSKDVLAQIGEISLQDQGTTDATEDDQYAEGQKLLDAWIADHDVEVNPKYAVDLDAPIDSATQVDTDLSVAVGTTAKDGLKAEPDAAYTSSLPGHLVCLD